MNRSGLLKAYLREKGKVAIAYSGGVDSTFLLKVAHDTIGKNALAITISSPAHPSGEIDRASAIAKEIGATHMLLKEELDSEVTENKIDRCYTCKLHEFRKIIDTARSRGYDCVVDGTNADDPSDYRPGLKALAEQGVASPLRDLGFTKAEIRVLSKELGLPTWDKPSNPCLMSRFPYGTVITAERLKQVDEAEKVISALGIKGFRVRYHNELARIEADPADFNTILNSRERITKELRKAGFKHISLDLAGFKSGSLNWGVR